mmetsp:Transcript_40193/g.40734  ORF Transcript_40193/g.40734 Transcript_40193/m.40734 type:complete len:421 (+) Transcript_40193:29-1291(+)
MGKRSNDLGQLKKEDYEAALAETSNAPKGPFEKASGEVMDRRRIVRARRKSPAVNRSSSASNPAPANIFSGVSLKTDSGAFGGSSFGNTTSSTTIFPAPTLPSSYPSFAMPATTSTIPKPSPTTMTTKNNYKSTVITVADKEKIKCAESFRKHMISVGILDVVAMDRFISTYNAIRSEEDNKMAASSSASTMETWNPSRPLFPTNPSTLRSTTPMTPTASPLFGVKSVVPSPTAAGKIGEFSFSLPTATAAAPAPVPSFSFSTKPVAEVKAATATTTSSNLSKVEDSNNNNNEENTVLEASDDEYNVICQCPSKVLQVSSNTYLARGNLKLEQNKENKKYRVVVRDKTVGRVLFNVAINYGMALKKDMVVPSSDTKKNLKPAYIIHINAVFKGTRPEPFKIVTTIDDQKVLYNELNKIVA